jgi:hypothetical protein
MRAQLGIHLAGHHMADARKAIRRALAAGARLPADT